MTFQLLDKQLDEELEAGGGATALEAKAKCGKRRKICKKSPETKRNPNKAKHSDKQCCQSNVTQKGLSMATRGMI